VIELCAGSIAGLKISNREDLLAAFIRCTADPDKAAKRTRNSRVTRYAAACKRDSEPLHRFIRRKGASTPVWGRLSRPDRTDARQETDEAVDPRSLERGAVPLPYTRQSSVASFAELPEGYAEVSGERAARVPSGGVLFSPFTHWASARGIA
jgi:hypothetical protein